MGNICELSTDPRAEAYGVRTQGNGREGLRLLALLCLLGCPSPFLALFLKCWVFS